MRQECEKSPENSRMDFPFNGVSRGAFLAPGVDLISGFPGSGFYHDLRFFDRELKNPIITGIPCQGVSCRALPLWTGTVEHV
jgi:hypothetical protein